MTMPTRRGLLGTVAALSVHQARGATDAPSTALPAAPAALPDADLLAACAEFDRLEWAHTDTFPGRDLTDAEEKAAEEERDLIRHAQHRLAERMVKLRATTLAGQVARARSLALWEGDDPTGDVGSKYVNERLLGAILRDLTERSAGV